MRNANRRFPFFRLSLLTGALLLGWFSAAFGQAIEEGNPRMDDIVGNIQVTDMGTPDVLQFLESLTGKAILRQQNLPAVRITFSSQGPLTRRDAILAVESLLALNGVAITEVGDKFLKAVPVASVNQQVPPLIEGTTLDRIPSQKIFSKFFKLEFLYPEEAQALVQPLMTVGAPQPYVKADSLFITDALINLQRIERILEEVDKPKMVEDEILFVSLSHTSATDIIRNLQQLAQTSLRQYFEGNTFFDADERTNQVIVITHPSNVPLIEDIIAKLDLDVAPLTTTEIYYIKHAEATEVVSVIDQVISGQQSVREEQGDTPNARNPNQQPPRQPANVAEIETKNLQFSDYLTIVSDERSNAVVASGTQNDQKFLRELIDKLDILLAQVRIEVVIAEVTLGNNWSRGIDAFEGPFNFQTGTDTTTVSESTTTREFVLLPPNNTPIPSAGDPSGTGFLTEEVTTTTQQTIFENAGVVASWIGGIAVPGGPLGGSPLQVDVDLSDGTFDIDVLIGIGRQMTDVSVLQAPTIVTTHNKEASIVVGESRPVITSTTDFDTGTGSSRSTVQFRDIGLDLKVKPLIGSNGVIQMEITQAVETVAGTTVIDGNEQPIIGTREATSFLGVRDGELVVLGGLQSVEDRETESRMFFFGELPLIGGLFRSKTNAETRTELLIFIKPTVIQNTTEANEDAHQAIGRSGRAETIREFLRTGEFWEPEEETGEAPFPPLDIEKKDRGPRNR